MTTESLILRAAEEAAGTLTTGTRDDGTEYVHCIDGTPDWVTDMIHAAHGHMLPDDWRYRMVQRTLYAIIEAGGDLDAAEYPVPPIYTHELLGWLSSYGDRPAYVDEAVQENGYPGDILEAVRQGWCAEMLEVFDSVRSSIEERAEKLEEQEAEEGEE